MENGSGPRQVTRTRIAAYGVCVVDGRILLARYVSPDGRRRFWTMPGGKVEHGEDPYHAVVREVAEETGYRVTVDRLLGIHSRTWPVPWLDETDTEVHGIAIFYRVRIVGGRLRSEVGGSTDLAQWTPVASLPSLGRAVVVEVAQRLLGGEPETGHVGTVSPGGLVRS